MERHDPPHDLARLRAARAGAAIGHTILDFPSVDSTNRVLRDAARAGAPHGLVALAEEQTAGRGRQGRSWVAPHGAALLCSVLLRPTTGAQMPMLAGLALCDAVEHTTGLAARLKWPNDLVLAQAGVWRKAAGILCEGGGAAHEPWVVVGMGINVHRAPASQIDGRDLAVHATCLAAAAGAPVSRDDLLLALLDALDDWLLAPALLPAWRARLQTLGLHVAAVGPTATLHGIAEDIDASGALLLRDAHDVLHRIDTADVRLYSDRPS